MYNKVLEFKFIGNQDVSDEMQIVSELTEGITDLTYELVSYKAMKIISWLPGDDYDHLVSKARRLEQDGKIKIIHPK